jgi:hypothetical protein
VRGLFFALLLLLGRAWRHCCGRYDKQVFHIHIAAGVTYLAMCDEQFERRCVLLCLSND